MNYISMWAIGLVEFMFIIFILASLKFKANFEGWFFFIVIPAGLGWFTFRLLGWV